MPFSVLEGSSQKLPPLQSGVFSTLSTHSFGSPSALRGSTTPLLQPPGRGNTKARKSGVSWVPGNRSFLPRGTKPGWLGTLGPGSLLGGREVNAPNCKTETQTAVLRESYHFPLCLTFPYNLGVSEKKTLCPALSPLLQDQVEVFQDVSLPTESSSSVQLISIGDHQAGTGGPPTRFASQA